MGVETGAAIGAAGCVAPPWAATVIGAADPRRARVPWPGPSGCGTRNASLDPLSPAPLDRAHDVDVVDRGAAARDPAPGSAAAPAPRARLRSGGRWRRRRCPTPIRRSLTKASVSGVWAVGRCTWRMWPNRAGKSSRIHIRSCGSWSSSSTPRPDARMGEEVVPRIRPRAPGPGGSARGRRGMAAAKRLARGLPGRRPVRSSTGAVTP